MLIFLMQKLPYFTCQSFDCQYNLDALRAFFSDCFMEVFSYTIFWSLFLFCQLFPTHHTPCLFFSLSVETEKHHFEILLILIIRIIFFTEVPCGQASGSQAEALAGRISNCSVHCPFSVSNLSLLNCKVSITETLRFCLYLWLTECYDFGYSNVISMF